MTTEVESEKGVARSMGTIMVIMWVLVIGLTGALLLGAVAYSMHVNNLILGLLCSILLFSPLLLTVAWGIGTAIHVRHKKSIHKSSAPSATEPIGSPTS